MKWMGIALATAWVIAGPARGQPVKQAEASDSKGVMLSLYDTGMALASELRSVTLAKGAQRIRFSRVPKRLETGSASFEPIGGRIAIEPVGQWFAYDLADPFGFLARWSPRPVEVVTAQGTARGLLMSAPSGIGDATPIALKLDDGTMALFPGIEKVDSVRFPGAQEVVEMEPALVFQIVASEEGPVQGRLWYMIEGLSWEVYYEVFLPEGRSEADLTGRAALHNRSGGGYEQARVQLVTTSRGILPPLFPAAGDTGRSSEAALRYAYGREEPVIEQAAVSSSALRTMLVPEAVDLNAGETRHVRLFRAERVPVRRLYVYDGVRFDRFQRNRRTDWNYGTEFHRTVDMRLAFENTSESGLGMGLPPGRLRFYSRSDDGLVDLLAETRAPDIPPGGSVDLLLGPARGLSGERERTGFNEVIPLRQAEESFEIRLLNDSAEDVDVMVREHLYRGEQFEIVKADTEYVQAGSHTIQFVAPLKAGGRRAIHYTVRYTW